MITDIFLRILGGIVYMLSTLFGAIAWTIPSEIVDAVEFFFSKIHSIDFLFPADTLMSALGVYLTFLIFWYGVKLILWAYHLIRHGGKTEPAKLHN